MIEKVNADYIVNSSFVISVTPEQLRHIANCMESKARVTLPGQHLFYPLTRRVLLMYDPDVTMEKLEKEIVAQALKTVPPINTQASSSEEELKA